ncbi:MAG: hypothetical protein ACI9LZ_002510 [Glaciecola sp.]|jgi:hypothetical protein
MPAWITSADNRPVASGFLPLDGGSLGKHLGAMEPLIYKRVKPRNQNVALSRSKGRPPCPLRTSSSPSQPVQALPHAAITLANKPLAAVSLVPVLRRSPAAACCKVQPSVQAQTCLLANPAQCAATNLIKGSAGNGIPSLYHNTDPAQPMLMRGFSVSSRPKGTAHVQ